MTVDALDFSDKVVFNGPLPSFSSSGKKYLALVQGCRLIVREVDTLAVVALFTCLDTIDGIAWSPCADHILCGMYKRGTVQVFSMTDHDWSCSITEGLAGVVAARWCPNGHQVLLTAEFQIKLSVWSLVDQSCMHLPPSKYQEAGLAFSPDGTSLAILERANSHDWLRVYDVNTWKTMSISQLPTTDAADLAWAPDNSCIAVWEGPSHRYMVTLLTPQGDCLATHKQPSYGLGIKTASWSPSGQLLVIGGYDGIVTILNNVTWTSLATLRHSNPVKGPTSAVIYRESTETLDNGFSNISANLKGALAEHKRTSSSGKVGHGGEATKRGLCKATGVAGRRPQPISIPRLNSPAPSNNSSPVKPNSARGQAPGSLLSHADIEEDPSDGSRDLGGLSYEVAELPVKIPARRPPLDKANPKMGVGIAAWSPDGAYLATRCDDSPNAVWIWDISRLQLASVLLQSFPVRGFEWDPRGGKNRLAVVCGLQRLYIWTPDGASCVRIPATSLRAVALRWRKDGGSLLVTGRDSFCCGYLYD